MAALYSLGAAGMNAYGILPAAHLTTAPSSVAGLQYWPMPWVLILIWAVTLSVIIIFRD